MSSFNTTHDFFPSNNNNNNNNTSQCGSRFRGVWGDPVVGNLTPTGIPTGRKVVSKRPTKRNLRKSFEEETFCKKTFDGKNKAMNDYDRLKRPVSGAKKHKSSKSKEGTIPLVFLS